MCSLRFPACASLFAWLLSLARALFWTSSAAPFFLYCLCSRSRWCSGHVCCFCSSSVTSFSRPLVPSPVLLLFYSLHLLVHTLGFCVWTAFCLLSNLWFLWVTKSVLWVSLKKAWHLERTSLMIIPRRLISPRKQTTHSGALFFFPSPHSIWLLRLEGWIVRIQHRLELVSERHQSLRDHLLCLTRSLSATWSLSPGISALSVVFSLIASMKPHSPTALFPTWKDLSILLSQILRGGILLFPSPTSTLPHPSS